MQKDKLEIPESLPEDLKDLVSRGCSHEPTDRPGLGEFRLAFHKMLYGGAATIQDEVKPEHTWQNTKSLINQVKTDGCTMEVALCIYFETESN